MFSNLHCQNGGAISLPLQPDEFAAKRSGIRFFSFSLSSNNQSAVSQFCPAPNPIRHDPRFLCGHSNPSCRQNFLEDGD
jgi:hypothetical protein